jgi:hypothetical protein
MIIDCISDPNELIENIGDLYFSIEDDKEAQTRNRIIIIDCEHEIEIVISTFGLINPFEAAKALCKLLNQEYIVK